MGLLPSGRLATRQACNDGVTTGDQWSEHVYVYNLQNHTLAKEMSNIVGDVYLSTF